MALFVCRGVSIRSSSFAAAASTFLIRLSLRRRLFLRVAGVSLWTLLEATTAPSAYHLGSSLLGRIDVAPGFEGEDVLDVKKDAALSISDETGEFLGSRHMRRLVSSEDLCPDLEELCARPRIERHDGTR